MKKTVLVLALSSILTSVHADTGLKTDAFALGVKAAEFGVIHAEFTKGDDEVCVVGSYINDEDARIYGRIMLLSTSKNKVLWQRKLPAPGENVNNSVVGCTRQEDFIYAVANVDTDSNKADSQSLVYVYKFDAQGNQLALENVKVPSDSGLAYGLSSADAELRIVGLGTGNDKDNEYYSMFVSKFNSLLAFDTTILKNGGFAQGSDFKIINKNLFVAGRFLPAKAKKNEVLTDYANSKIRLGGGYVWSVRPPLVKTINVFSTVSESAEIYSMSYEKTTTFFSMVDQAGKISTEFKYPSLLCKTKSMATLGDNILAIRAPCGDPFGKAVLVNIDRKSGIEKELKFAKNEAVFVFASKKNWFAITKNAGGSLLFRTGSAEGGL